MKIFRIVLILLWVLSLVAYPGERVRLVPYGQLDQSGILSLSGNIATDTIEYLFPRSGSARFPIVDGNLGMLIKTNLVNGSTTDSVSIVYKTLWYKNTSWTVQYGHSSFPVFTQLDWDSGGYYEYPNTSSTLYPWGPCVGIAIIGTFTTATSTDCLQVEITELTIQ